MKVNYPIIIHASVSATAGSSQGVVIPIPAGSLLVKASWMLQISVNATSAGSGYTVLTTNVAGNVIQTGNLIVPGVLSVAGVSGYNPGAGATKFSQCFYDPVSFRIAGVSNLYLFATSDAATITYGELTLELAT